MDFIFLPPLSKIAQFLFSAWDGWWFWFHFHFLLSLTFTFCSPREMDGRSTDYDIIFLPPFIFNFIPNCSVFVPHVRLGFMILFSSHLSSSSILLSVISQFLLSTWDGWWEHWFHFPPTLYFQFHLKLLSFSILPQKSQFLLPAWDGWWEQWLCEAAEANQTRQEDQRPGWYSQTQKVGQYCHTVLRKLKKWKSRKYQCKRPTDIQRVRNNSSQPPWQWHCHWRTKKIPDKIYFL